MPGRAQLRQDIVTAYLLVVVLILLLGQIEAPQQLRTENALIFISDFDPIDASRGSNSAYSIGLDGRGMKRIAGSIRHDDLGFIRISDVSCHVQSQVMTIASGRQDFNGFHLVNLDGSELRQVSGGPELTLRSVRQVAMAPDGAGLIFSREFSGYPQARFGLIQGNLQSQEQRMIKMPALARSYRSPVWSSDGGQIGYIIEMRDDEAPLEYAIAIAAPDGGHERIIHRTRLVIADIDWSPDGEWIATAIGMQIYRLRPDGSDLTRLTDHHAGVSFPRWSPDGGQISYVAPSSFQGHHQLMVMDADGSNIRRVANIRGGVVNGCWV